MPIPYLSQAFTEYMPSKFVLFSLYFPSQLDLFLLHTLENFNSLTIDNFSQFPLNLEGSEGILRVLIFAEIGERTCDFQKLQV